MSTMVEVSVARLGLDGSTNTYVVILKESGGDRVLPIWIGQAEAESILLEMNHVKKERPLTHDLCKALIVGLGGVLTRVDITRVRKGTYFAELHVDRGSETYRIDARPSDSIAIALRVPAPIFVDEVLLALPGEEAQEAEEEGGLLPETPPVQSTDEMTADQLKQYLSGLRPEDFGKFHL
ncbi:MAG: bifunctional nuclease family protein [Gemmatimonadetes bacterium]|nr:bifunctional nuclease family protein [Gemmatimonadota bacterium]MCC6774371.1 bifunctional nuclease family protein [Gemmatimonadaceae bacterium]